MFIGHFGVALAAKKITPKASLGTLIFAAQLLDLLWPILLLLGWEHVRIAPGITKVSPFDFSDYPISHSLPVVVGWSITVAAGHFSFRRDRRAAVVLGLAVLSHWILDFLTHRPDLPLWPGGPKVGLGLWNSWVASTSSETLLFVGGLVAYVSITKSRDKIGRYGFWSFMIFLVIAWIASLGAGAPPNTTTLAWGGLSIWITVLWGWWADTHRRVIPRA
jgi:membrane-bound metal-dependent hydrolase YbcI (DUF457 family)